MSQPKREPINRYRPLTQGEARALGGGLMRVPTKEEANKGDYVEYSEYQQLAADHAALVQQGIRDHADWRSKLNFLEADYKAEIARLTAEKEAETRATFDAIRTITQLRDDYAALAAENERLRKAGDEVALHYAERIEIEAGETAKTLMRTLPVLKAWNAAKEGGNAK